MFSDIPYACDNPIFEVRTRLQMPQEFTKEKMLLIFWIFLRSMEIRRKYRTRLLLFYYRFIISYGMQLRQHIYMIYVQAQMQCMETGIEYANL